MRLARLALRIPAWPALCLASAGIALALSPAAFADNGATVSLGTLSGGQLLVTATDTSTAGETLFNIDGGLAAMSGFQLTGATISPGASSFCGVVGPGHDQFACNWNPELAPSSSGQVTLSLTPADGYAGGVSGMVCFDPSSTCLPFTVAQGASTQVGAGGGGPPPPGGGGAGHCDWVVSFDSPPAVAMVGSDLHYKLEVRNAGTAACPQSLLRVVPDPGNEAGRDTLIQVDAPSGTFAPSGGFAVQALAPGASQAFDILTIPAVPLPATGVLTLTARMPVDDDGGADEFATATTDLRVLGLSGANSPCAAHGSTAAANGACSIPAARVRGFSGIAAGQIIRVQVALGRLTHGAHFSSAVRRCAWLRSARAKFVSTRASGRVCNRPRWLNAKGKKRWHFALRGRLPRGRYVLYTRPVTPGGAPVVGFSQAHRNRLTFRLR